MTVHMTEDERGKMLAYIRESGAIEKSQQVSDMYLRKAIAEVESLAG